MSLKPKPPSRTTEFDILKLQNEKNEKNGKKIVKGKMPSHRVWPSKKGIQGPPKELVLKDIAEAQGNIRETLVIRNQAPWDTFQPVYKCDLAGEFYVVTSRAFPYQLAAVREIHQQGISDEKVLNILRNVRHSNVLEARECFIFGKKIYYLHDDISITVDNIVSCGIPLSESEIGSIIHQFLQGLGYLKRNQYGHSSIGLDKILFNSNGVLKIGGMEHIIQGGDVDYRETLRLVTTELSKQVHEDLGVDFDVKYPMVHSFLCSVECNSFDELCKEPLVIPSRCKPGYLIGLISFVQRASFVYCDYSVEIN